LKRCCQQYRAAPSEPALSASSLSDLAENPNFLEHSCFRHDAQELWAEDLELHEYLGMTHEEYEVWLCDPVSLPAILHARQSGRALVEIMADRYNELRAANRRADATIPFSLDNWLKHVSR
jgi:hypothetical protein